MHQHVIVASHRRSGTHLAIDSIGNNFSRFRDVFAESGLVNVDHVRPGTPDEEPLSSVRDALARGPRIVKTHSPSDMNAFFGTNGAAAELVRDVLDASSIVYVQRSPADVLWSLYHYHARWEPAVLETPFTDYIRQPNSYDTVGKAGDMDRAEYLAYHVAGWLSRPGVAVVRFESLAGHMRDALATLSARIGDDLRADHLVNPYQSTGKKLLLHLAHVRGVSWIFKRVCWRVFPEQTLTHVLFRKGKVGEGVKACSSDDLAFIRERLGQHFYLPEDAVG